MTRHGISHGAATLVTVVVAGLLTEHFRAHMPVLARPFDRLADWLAGTGVTSLTAATLSPLLLGSMLAVIWGVAFALLTGSHKRTR